MNGRHTLRSGTWSVGLVFHCHEKVMQTFSAEAVRHAWSSGDISEGGGSRFRARKHLPQNIPNKNDMIYRVVSMISL